MAMRYPQKDIEAVRERSRIVEIIESVTPLRNAGGGRLKGLCLFHDERTPSMTVNPSDNHFHCFGCGEGGDVIHLVQLLYGHGFPEAIEFLAAQFNITVEASSDSGGEIVSRPTRIYEANARAYQYFRDALLSGRDQAGRDFLQDRQWDLTTSVERFSMGYAPNTRDGLVKHLLALKFTKDEILDAGLAHRKDNGPMYDVFQGRPLWAIRDSFGHYIGFGARKIRDDDRRDGKFVNTSETPVYKKSKVLYGIDLARRSMAKLKQAIVVEGYADVMAMHLAGVENVVATCGTSLTEDHLSILRRIVGEDGEIIFCFDGDKAGRTAAMRAYSIGKGAVRRMSVLQIEGGLDPDSMRVQHGLESLPALLDGRRPLIESVIKATISESPMSSPEDRVIALDKVAEQMSGVLDPILRGQYAPMAADLLGLPLREVAKKLNVEARESTASASSKGHQGPARQSSRSFERDALQLVAQHPELPICKDLLSDVLYQSAPAQALLPTFTWWYSGRDHSTSALMQAAPPEYSAAVREIVMEVFDVPDLEMYGQELLARLVLHMIEREISEMKLRITENPNDIDAYHSLRALRQEHAELRS